MNAGTSLTGLFGGALSSQASPVGGHRIIGGMIPANVIPDEILTDHPKRFRAMLIEAKIPRTRSPTARGCAKRCVRSNSWS